MARPRVADDFPTIRARMEELRRERVHTSAKNPLDAEETASGGRRLLRPTEGRQRIEPERSPAGSPARRYGSGR